MSERLKALSTPAREDEQACRIRRPRCCHRDTRHCRSANALLLRDESDTRGGALGANVVSSPDERPADVRGGLAEPNYLT